MARKPRQIHGQSRTRFHHKWRSIIDRCENPNCMAYHRYGGRGITVCDEWRNDFLAFQRWAMATGYRNGLTIERRNNNGNYEPSNCIWIPMSKQARNTSKTVYISAFSETKPLMEWLEDDRFVVNRYTFESRVKMGWSPEEAMSLPPNKRRPRPAGLRQKPRGNEHYLTMFGETKIVQAWAEDPRCRVCGATFRQRLFTGWSPEKALTTPPSNS